MPVTPIRFRGQTDDIPAALARRLGIIAGQEITDRQRADIVAARGDERFERSPRLTVEPGRNRRLPAAIIAVVVVAVIGAAWVLGDLTVRALGFFGG